MDIIPSLQDLYSPRSLCFGCGPKNEKGLRLKSFPLHPDDPQSSETIAHFEPESHHQAYENIVNGGIIGALLDCHSNWTAAYFLMKRDGKDKPDCTVTADFHVTLKRPTPLNATLTLYAHIVDSGPDRATVEATIEAPFNIAQPDGTAALQMKTTATCRGTFVAVKPGHPAYHRW